MAHIVMEQLESSFQSADAYAASLLSLEKFEKYLSTPAAPRNKLVKNIVDVRSVLPRPEDRNNILSDFFIYSKASNSIINHISAYLRPEYYYEALFKIPGYDYDAWDNKIINNTDYYDIISANNGEVILYSKRISFNARFQGRVIYTLSKDRIMDTFKQYSTFSDLNTLTLFYNNNILFTDNSVMEEIAPLYAEHGVFDGFTEISINRDKYILCAIPVSKHGLSLYITTPKSYFTNHAMSLAFSEAKHFLPVIIGITV